MNSTCDKNNKHVESNSIAHKIKVEFIGVFRKIIVVAKSVTIIHIIRNKYIILNCKSITT